MTKELNCHILNATVAGNHGISLRLHVFKGGFLGVMEHSLGRADLKLDKESTNYFLTDILEFSFHTGMNMNDINQRLKNSIVTLVFQH